MRRVLTGIVLALAFTGAAEASDFIVVNSTDPAIARGQAFDGGAKVPLASGKKLTLMRASGEVTTVQGAPAGVTLPSLRVASADSAKFDTLHALLAPPPEGRTFGARRGGFCPPADSLVTIDDILRVAQSSGCKAEARTALDAYVAKAAASK
jgi:hypothetical protein